MTTTVQPTIESSPPRTPRDQVAAGTSIVLFGTLAWLAWVWLAATVVYGGILAAVVRWGDADESLWQSVVSGWQRYLVFAAGVTVTTTFMRMFVRNGATRRVLSSAAIATMAAIAVLVAIWNVVGYSIEHVVYDRQGWSHGLRSEALFAWSDLPRIAIDNGLVVAAYFASGWIVGACYVRWGALGGTLRLLPALVPAAAMEFLVTPDFGGMDVDVLASWRDRPAVAVTVVAGGLVLAATLWLARRVTRDVPLRC